MDTERIGEVIVEVCDNPFTQLLGCLLALGALLYFLHLGNEKTTAKGYAAWCKQTGNEQQLTLEEWTALVRTTKASGDTIYIHK
jgi:hypothetical protein